MKFSENLRWFNQVSLDEQNGYIECLVDSTDTELNQNEGYFLVWEGRELKVCSPAQLQNRSMGLIIVLGRIKKREHKI